MTTSMVAGTDGRPSARAERWSSVGIRRLVRPKVLLPLGFVALVGVLAIVAPWASKVGPLDTDPTARLQGPGTTHWMGTDKFGRDTMSRLLHGSRIAILVPFAAVTISSVVGVSAGLIAARFARVGNLVIMRGADLLLAFPPIMLALTMMAFLDGGLTVLILTIAILFAPRMARVTFAAAAPLYSREFVTAARVSGVREWAIMLHYILPNALGPVLVEISLELGFATVLESGLSFLGLGVRPPTPSWGGMTADARGFMDLQPWGIVFPACALVAFVLSCNLLSDGLRDALDPRLAN